MSKIKAWIHAFRLRTLPLSISGIVLGSFLAAADDSFSWMIFTLAIFTTLSLQILSNLANDLGDSVSGADNANRIGPKRSVQSGAITKSEIKRMLVFFVGLSLITGGLLVYEAIKYISLKSGLMMFLLGLVAIGAAINYTIGRKPYGYSGFGDVFVFVFFGLTAVVGVYFLHTGSLPIDVLLPASSVGFLSVGVLNLNNMRDYENDKNTGKRTLVVVMGERSTRKYHTIIIFIAVTAALTHTYLNWNSAWQLLYLVSLPLLAHNLKVVWRNKKPSELDPELKKLALTTLLFTVTFGVGIIMSTWST